MNLHLGKSPSLICADQLPVFLPGAASPKSPVASLIPITAF